MSSNPVRRSRRSCVLNTAAFALCLALVGAVSARDLPSVDALNVAAGPPGLVAQPAPVTAPAAMRASYEKHLGIPTFVFAADSYPQRAGLVQVAADPVSVARGYLKELAASYRITPAEIDALPVSDRQTLPGGAVLVQFGHTVQGIEVFREHASVLIGASGKLVSVGGYVSGAGAIASEKVASLYTSDAATAISRVLADFGASPAATRGRLIGLGEQGGYQHFTLDSAAAVKMLVPARAKQVLFREPAGLVPAWYVEVDVAASKPGERDDYYAYVMSAKDGAMLFRHNLTADATAYSYRVWAETGFPYLPYPGPQGRNGTPNPSGQPDGYQAPFVAPNLVTLLNALPPTSVAANDPWLPDAATASNGNNVDAFANLTAPDDYNTGDLRASPTGPTAFDRVFDTGQDPQVNNEQIQAAVTQLFYMNNWLHDWYYDVGFDEAAGNAQTDNYGRGGIGNDNIRAQAQDYAGFNNANMSTPADGGRPRMRMYVFTGIGASRVVNQSSTSGVNPEIKSQGAQFGPAAFDLTQDLVLADDGDATGGSTYDGCQALVNGSAMSGKIALIQRGACTFVLKVKNAQNAGAVGVLIYNNTPDTSLPGMAGTDGTITIPSLGITTADGAAMKTALDGAETVTMRMQLVAGIRRDGTIDDTVIAHEWGHYISNRLVQNASGLSTNQSAGMGEGFGDFHALLMMVKAEDTLVPTNPNFSGVYTEGGYVEGGPSFAINPNLGFYYGFRRYPYSTNFARNPLTFKYIENNVPLPVNPAPIFGQNGASNAEVHNTGEVWASMLWECYSSLLRDTGRLSFDEAQERMKTYLVAGYKLMPPAPTFTEARDAILSAAKASDRDDFVLCAGGFARRGLGSGAQPPSDRYGSDNAGVVESFTTAGSMQVESLALNDAGAGCDNDGVLDNGEQGTLLVTVHNSGFQAIGQVTLELSSPDASVTFPNPTVVAGGIDAQASSTFAVPIALDGAPADSAITVNVTATASGVADASGNDQFRVATDSQAAVSTTDDFEADIFAWTPSVETLPSDPAYLWSRTRIDGDPLAHAAHAPDVGGQGLNILTSPVMQVASSGDFTVSFAHRYQFEFDMSANYDGGVIEISTDGGATWQDVTAAGGVMTPAYNGVVSNCCGNPLSDRNAFVQQNPGATTGSFDTVSIDFGTALAGQSVQLRFVIGTDAAVGAYGWDVDDFAATSITNTPFPMLGPDANLCLGDVVFQDGFDGAP